MASLTCPTCRRTFHDLPSLETPCPGCGRSLFARPIPQPATKRDLDYRLIARRQRWLLWLVLIAIAAIFLPLFGIFTSGGASMAMLILMGIVRIVMHVLLVVGAVLILTSMRTHPAITIICGFLMLAPCANLIFLVFINMSATRTMRKAGLHVGLMGVKDEEAERLMNPRLCRKCGYDMTGNVSGRCPECGLDLPRAVPVSSVE